MKKVLVLAAALCLLASPAFAVWSSVVNSKHNLSANGPTRSTYATNYNEVCVFCHTPHSASMATTGAPLWNRTGYTLSLTTNDLYNSSTLETTSRPTQTVNGVTNLDAVINSDAPLCYSCHSGTNVKLGLANPANTSNNAQPASWNNNDTTLGTADIFDATYKLKNDHPIGINYSKAYAAEAAVTAKNGLYATATVEAAGLKVTYGTSNDRLWCSSCHDVHNDEFGPFLLKSNTRSDLCTTCHRK